MKLHNHCDPFLLDILEVHAVMRNRRRLFPAVMIFIFSSLIALLPLFAHDEEVTSQLRQSPSGERALAYFEAFNSGDAERMRAYFLENLSETSLKQRSVEERLAVFQQLKADLGRVEIRRMEKKAIDNVILYGQSQKGEWLQYDFKFEPGPPHKLLTLRVDMTDEPTEEPLTPLGGAEALAIIQHYLDSLAQTGEFSGAVLFADGEDKIFRQAYGLASREFVVPNRIDTKFNLGSINKIFTKIAIAQLIQKGKLSFDTRLGEILPDYPNKDAREKVTVRHLLNMTSGIGDFFNERFDALPKNRLRSNNDYLPLFADMPLLFEPGTQRRYSNGGYVVLGAIVEKVSGTDYYDYIRENIYKPAGMESTDSYQADMINLNLATGYTGEAMTDNNGALRSNFYTRPARGSAAGGGYSNVEDLLRFVRALSQGKLLDARFTNWVVTNELPEPQNAPSLPLKQGTLGIAGGAPGINAMVEADFSSGLVVIVMANLDPPKAENVARRVRQLMARVKF